MPLCYCPDCCERDPTRREILAHDIAVIRDQFDKNLSEAMKIQPGLHPEVVWTTPYHKGRHNGL